MTDAAEILNRAADLVEPEGAWTRHWMARNAAGEPVSSTSPAAVSFCVLGAIVCANGGEWPHKAIDLLESHVDGRNAAEWNNDPERTQAEVVQALRDTAIAAQGDGK